MKTTTESAATGPIAERFPTLDHVWLAAALTIVIIRALVWPITPSDYWWQLAYGRWIVDNGAIPLVDHFSFTRAGEPYYDQPWLSQVLMYGIFRVGGAALSLVTFAATLALTYTLLLRVCILRGGSVRLSAGLLILSLAVGMTNWSLRSQVFAMPILVGYLLILETWRRTHGARGNGVRHDGQHRHVLWLLPLLMVVWVNMHGSFVLGGVLIALVFAGELLSSRSGWREALERVRPLLLWGGLTAVAILVNPRGPRVFEYVFGLMGNPAIQRIVDEWLPTTTASIVGRLFFLYAMLVAGAAAMGRRRPNPVDLLVLAVFFWLALSGERHVMWFSLVSLPILVEQLASAFNGNREHQDRQGNVLMNRTFLAAMLLGVLLLLPPFKTHLPLPPHLRPLISVNTPVASVEYLRDAGRSTERLFHTEMTGSFLMWAAPEQKVFVDARVELYPADQLQAYRMLNAGLAVDSLLAAYAIDGLLLDKERQGRLLEWARMSEDWDVRFEEECCTYLVKPETAD